MKKLFRSAFILISAVNFIVTAQPIWAADNPTLEPCALDLTRVAGQEVEASFHAAYPELIKADQKFLDDMDRHPAETYVNLRNQVRQALTEQGVKPIQRGPQKGLLLANSPGVDFSFAPHKPIVERVVQDLEQRLTRRYGEEFKTEILAAQKKARKLLDKNTPYKATIRYVMFEYLPLIDKILGKRHPKYMKNEYHRRNAEHLIEKLMAKAPDQFFYFSFNDVSDEFFINTRPAVMNLIGLFLSGLDDVSDVPYGDKFFMKISEFAYHDIGHAEFTTARDLEYLHSTDKEIVQVVWEWEFTRLRIRDVVEQVRARDNDLADAMNAILFELLRERGFQFSLSVLKQELETAKWVDVILTKLNAGFYKRQNNNKKKYTRLEEARKLLVAAVERLKEVDQLKWNDTLHADVVPCRVTHTPTLTYSQGRLRQMIIGKTGPVKVQSVTANGREEITEIRELISAQVKATKTSPLTTEVVGQIEKALRLENVEVVLVNADKTIAVRLTDGTLTSLAALPLAELVVAGDTSRQLQNIEIFEMNQVLGTEDRKRKQRYTVRPPVKVYKGTLTTEQDLITGRHTVIVRTLDGEKVVLPLVEIRIDRL